MSAKATRSTPLKKIRTQPRPKSAPAVRLPQAWIAWLACPACGATVKVKARELVCAKCGRHYPVVDNIPVMLLTENMDAVTRKSLEDWNAEWSRRTLPPDGNIEADPAHADAMNHIRQHAPGKEWGLFLEAGCGDARKALVIARQRKTTIVGVDACLEACRLAQQLFAREKQKGFFVVGDLKQLPFQAQVFGYIYAGGSMEHFTDTGTAVKEAWRVLRPHGRITATVPFVSLATLLYAQRWGNIPELPLIKPLAEWVHIRLLKGRHMIYGYEKSFTLRGLKNYFFQAGFEKVHADVFITHMDFMFLPWRWLKAMARQLVKLKWFWPVVYVDADRGGK